ncbi:LysR family transcriptional regulator [Vibrio genomosp. F6]|uniref:LysR family transcriptional regulator n=1 Tax=Vibrio genomosp. F6 TaxID=723172 RepID=UPI0010BE1855|nr:LysR family transcriptional regulator [Vibrio genomosp. F6]TKF19739.1 LysR family transcriptional regulator [Vibrio genomosp. F6]
MFSIEQLEAFQATIDTGSFSAAARKLGKAQSAVSQHVINLEIDCGCELFDRSGRYPILTEEGKKLAPYASATLIQHKRLIGKIDTLTDHYSSTLVIAVDEGIPLQKITTILKDLHHEYPQLSVELLSATSIDIIEMVQSGQATTGIIFSELSMPSCIDFESVGSIAFDVYVSNTHPLAQEVAPHIDMLRLHRQLLISSRDSKQSSFHQAHSPDIWYTGNYYMLFEMAKSGLGWCLLPSHLAEDPSLKSNLIRVPVEFENLTWFANVDVIQHQNKSNEPMHKRARQMLRTLLKKEEK